MITKDLRNQRDPIPLESPVKPGINASLLAVFEEPAAFDDVAWALNTYRKAYALALMALAPTVEARQQAFAEAAELAELVTRCGIDRELVDKAAAELRERWREAVSIV